MPCGGAGSEAASPMACNLGVPCRVTRPGTAAAWPGSRVAGRHMVTPPAADLMAGAHPREGLVHLYDIKWPSIRSFVIQVLFTLGAYQWAWTGKACPSALGSRTSEGKLSLDAEQAQPPFGGRAGRRALAGIALASGAAPPGRLRQTEHRVTWISRASWGTCTSSRCRPPSSPCPRPRLPRSKAENMTASAPCSGTRNGQLGRRPSGANVPSRETVLRLKEFFRLPIVAGQLGAGRSRRHAE